MSLKLGKILGVTSSLIAVIAPVVAAITGGYFIYSIVSQLWSSIYASAGTVPSLSSFAFVLTLIEAFGIASLIGAILFILAMYSLAKYYKEKGIFRNILYCLITILVGAIISVILAVHFTSMLPQLTSGQASTAGIPPAYAALYNIFLSFQQLISAQGLMPLIASLVELVAVVVIVVIVSLIFIMRAFHKLGEKSGNHSFHTAGWLIVLNLIPVIGILIGWFGWILATAGFGSLKPKTAETSILTSSIPQATVKTAEASTFPNATPQAAVPSMPQQRSCPYCGAENTVDSVYCMDCGKKLE